jgi:hypothetical protein
VVRVLAILGPPEPIFDCYNFSWLVDVPTLHPSTRLLERDAHALAEAGNAGDRLVGLAAAVHASLSQGPDIRVLLAQALVVGGATDAIGGRVDAICLDRVNVSRDARRSGHTEQDGMAALSASHAKMLAETPAARRRTEKSFILK